MKTMKSIIALAIVFVIGLSCGSFLTTPHKVHAQSTSPSYICQFGNGGANNTSPCVQYIVEISTARMGGGAAIYQVTDTPFPVDGTNTPVVVIGTISGTSTQQSLPNNLGGTFTLAITEP